MKPIYLAKEAEGSVIEVRKHGRDWMTLDGRCIYERGSFEWTIPMAVLEPHIKRNQ